MPSLGVSEHFKKSIISIEKRLTSDVMVSYRDFRIQMLDQVDRLGLSPGVLIGMDAGIQAVKADVQAAVQAAGPGIVEGSQDYAERQVKAIRKAIPAIAPATVPKASNDIEMVQSIESAVSASISAIQARMTFEISRMRLSGESDQVTARLLSTRLVDGRVSVWRNGLNAIKNSAVVAVWAAANGIGSDIYHQIMGQTGEKYGRQAIAAIDERTTDCCLRVHGQIVPMDGKFHLTGRPRFARNMSAPPFHWNCRTAVALYHLAMEGFGTTTAEMEEAARAERSARRRTGKRVEIHPAHGTSRRP